MSNSLNSPIGGLARTATPEEMEKLQEELKKQNELMNKMWVDLTVDEKLERMREQVKYQLSELKRNVSRMNKDVYKLTKHEHRNDGKIMVPYMESTYSDLPGGLMANNDWF